MSIDTAPTRTPSVPTETERELAPLPLLRAEALDEGDATRTRHVPMGGTWTLHVRPTPAGPRVARSTVDNRWLEGDPSVLVAAIA